MVRSICLAVCFFMVVPVVLSDGNETFDNENAPSGTYGDGSFVGNDGVTWNYVACRSGSDDGGAYEINGSSLMLRQASSSSSVYSESLEGGILDFSVNLRKAFTGSGNRQVELFINGVSKGTSEAFDDTAIHPFVVNGINEPGNVVIEIRNITEKQVNIDDLVWTSLTGGDDPNLAASSSLDFGELEPGMADTQTLVIVNSGTSLALNVSSILPLSGDTAFFSVLTVPPLVINPNGATGQVAFSYNPGAVTGAVHSAVFALISDDQSDPTNLVTLTGRTAAEALTVYGIQYTVAGSGDSPLNGQEVEFIGVATYVDSHGYIISDAAGGPWSGVYVDDDNHRPELGDRVRITGTMNELNSFTQVENVSDYILLSVSNAIPAPVSVTSLTMGQEQWEAVAVCLTNVTVSSQYVSGTRWEANDGSGTVGVLHDYARRLYRYIPLNGSSLDALCGVVWQQGASYRLQPRDDDDFVGRPVMNYALKGLVMTPGGPLTNGYVEIWDDDIVSVGTAMPTVTVVATGGIIFPGLMDTHNHPAWNSFPTLQFNNAPFGHRDEWGASDQEYTDWKGRRTTMRNHALVQDSSTHAISRYAEVLELMSGCIAIQGNASSIEYTHPVAGILNLELFPSRMEVDIFPWTMSSSERTALKARIDGGALNAVLIHLSEGVDETARAQFDTWYGWGMLDETTAIIHGVPYGTNEYGKMAAAGASLIWSPKSNMKLYHGTCNIPLAKSLGVNIGLAPDWTASGSYNMLEELGYAWYINQSQFTNYLTPRDLVDMVTINNAMACGLYHRYGKVASGYNAGMVVISGDTNDPYMALIDARPADVLMTVIDGTPRFGDPGLLSGMGITGETVNAWGTAKTLNLVNNHPFLTYDTVSFSTLHGNLDTAHGTLTTTGELDLEELQFLSLSLIQGGPDDVVPFVADAPLSSPANGSSYTINDAGSLTFRSQDFWDNDADHFNLVHQEVSIVPASDPDDVLQVIASNLTNENSNETINFTYRFRGLHTNYYFRFLTADLEGNVRTALIDTVGFSVAAAAGDADNDKLEDAWEQQIIDANPGDGIATIADVFYYADYDSDGFTEEQEQYAGTYPTNNTSLVEVEDISVLPVDGKIVVQWPSAAGKTYSLISITNLAERDYAFSHTGIAATPPLNSFTNDSPGNAFLFSIRVE